MIKLNETCETYRDRIDLPEYVSVLFPQALIWEVGVIKCKRGFSAVVK